MFKANSDKNKVPFRRERTPTRIQMEAVECGAAALCIVLAKYKLYIPPEELRIACGVSRDGSKASNVVKAARTYGMLAKGLKREPSNLSDLTLPFIIFWNFNHFVVVEGFDNKYVYLNDPATGPRKVNHQDFDRSFTGVVLALERGPDFKSGGESPSIVNGLKSRIKGGEKALLYLFLAGLALVLPGLVVPVFTKIFVDEILVMHYESWVKPLLLAMVCTTLITGALTWLKSFYLAKFRTVIGITTASKFFWHVLRLPVVFYAQRSAGEISSRVAINESVANLLAVDLAQAFLNIIVVIFYLLLMFFYDQHLTLISLVIALLNIGFLKLVSRTQIDANQKLSIDSGKLFGTSMNGLRLIESIKASGMEGDFFAKWAGYQVKVLNSQQTVGRNSVWLGAFPPLLSTLNSVLILGIGGLKVMDGQLTMGMLVAFQSLMGSFIRPINELVGLGSRIQELHGNMNRLDDVLNYKIDSRCEDTQRESGISTQPFNKPKLNGYLELRDLTFGYSSLEPALLNNFSLSLKPGSRVALVGPSGCGKSTVAKLVMGLYNPWQGEVFFDGYVRNEIDHSVYINSIALVDQDIALFDGTVRDNLTMWDSTISETDLVQAAKDAEIHTIIAARIGSYDSLVGEMGANFSGGQRQRMAIARALVRNPSIIVMDEATSALDPVTEQLIDANIRRRGCTCLIVAHRLSTIRDCDEIIVLERGRVVQRGSHTELMNLDGLYSKLIHSE